MAAPSPDLAEVMRRYYLHLLLPFAGLAAAGVVLSYVLFAWVLFPVINPCANSTVPGQELGVLGSIAVCTTGGAFLLLFALLGPVLFVSWAWAWAVRNFWHRILVGYNPLVWRFLLRRLLNLTRAHYGQLAVPTILEEARRYQRHLPFLPSLLRWALQPQVATLNWVPELEAALQDSDPHGPDPHALAVELGVDWTRRVWAQLPKPSFRRLALLAGAQGVLAALAWLLLA